MANVKITDLTALSAADVASDDVLPIVDINVDQTKKIAISDLIAATSAANDFITYTQLNANLNVLDANADAIETRRVANVTEQTAIEARRAANVVLRAAEDTALQARLTTNVSAFTTEDTALQARLTTNVSAFTTEDTALQARLTTNVSAFTTEDTALQARIAANTLLSASNDFITFTRLNANINVVQDNVAGLTSTLTIRGDNASDDTVTLGTETLTFKGDTGLTTTVSSNTVTIDLDDTAVTAGLYGGVSGGTTNVATVTIDATGRITNAANVSVVTDLDTIQDNVVRVQQNAASNTDAVEARRVANIAGAVSTITTGNLTTSRALISGSGGKVEVSDITSTELGHLDGISGSIQTQLDAKAPLAGATFTGQVNMSDDLVVTGNLVVNGDTTTANSVNLIVQDRMVMLANSATGAPSADVGFLFNRGNQGNAAFFYDESASTFKLSDTKDPSSNASLSPVTASNLDVGIVTAATVNATAITQNGATLDNLIGSNVDGAISTVNDTNLTASRALVSSGSGKIEVSAVSSTEIGHLDGVSSAIQTQLDAVESRRNANVTVAASNNAALESRRTANIAGAISTVLTSDLTASRAVISGSGGKLEVSAITSTELGHLDGITQNINANLTALAAGVAGASSVALPTGDYGLLDAANVNTDAFTVVIGGLTIFDLKTTPTGTLDTEDLGALS